MTELERALVLAGYRVITWSAIDDISRRERATQFEAAKRAGADFLFRVNSVEVSTASGRRYESWTRTFYESNERGEREDPASLSPERAGAIDAAMRQLEDSYSADMPSVSVSVSVAQVPSGEVTWFYEWTAFDADAERSPTIEELFVCDGEHQAFCRRWLKWRPEQPVAREQKRASGADEVRDEQHHALLVTVLEDMVQAFGRR
jgi:hypothetical protein